MRGWGSRRKWPPSPFVEDEDDSLAHEVTTPLTPSTKSDEEAQSKGSIDQYPIILDVDLSDAKQENKDQDSLDHDSLNSQSSDESLGPATPPSSSSDRPRQRPSGYTTRSKTHPERQKPTEVNRDNVRHATQEARGRPNVSRINTNLDGDLQYMLSGQRRAPSPYRYVRSEQDEPSRAKARFSGDSLLSPEAPPPRQGPSDTSSRRPTSARPPQEKRVDFSSSEDSDRRRRHHSRRRSTRESFTTGTQPRTPHEEEKSKSSLQGAGSPPSSTFGVFSPKVRDERREVKYHAEPGRRQSRLDSPQTSSAEESKPRHHERSRRRDRSANRSERPFINLASRSTVDPLTPRATARSSPIIEQHDDGRRHRHELHNSRHDQDFDRRSHRGFSTYSPAFLAEQDWEKALRDNQDKRFRNPVPSTRPSPRCSPPRTPPRTPRSSVAGDYFSVPLGIPNQGPASRSGAQSRSGNHEDSRLPTPLSRSGTLDDLRFLPNRQSNVSTPTSLPRTPRMSAEFLTGPHGMAPAAEARLRSGQGMPPIIDQRVLPRTTSYCINAVEQPKVIQRAFSYSTTDQSSREQRDTPRNSQAFIVPAGLNARSKYALSSPPDRPPVLPPFVPSSIDHPVCPNKELAAGHSDWYTVVGLPELNFCRTCMTVLGKSHLRNLFVPSPPETARHKTRCAMSQPWLRLAWIQTMKQRRQNLDMMLELVNMWGNTKHCPGKIQQTRSWFGLYDPERQTFLPDFDACSACVRAIVIVFPQLKDNDFTRRSKDLLQEKFCQLNCSSRRFPRYMALLEAAANECETKDLSRQEGRNFRQFAMRASRYRECERSDQLVGELWHFIPQLPEFTICEECFHDVVWPVRDQPVANLVIRTLQAPPGTDRNTPISCQLYSDRMRKVFSEAIRSRDFDYLQQVALRRHKFEGLLMAKKEMILRDHEIGKDRTEELGKLIARWKEFE